jgi:hypothetical protein
MITQIIRQFGIEIGSHPSEQDDMDKFLKEYQVILNVSDYPFYWTDKVIYWYPIEEWGAWGYGPFYWVVNVLDYHINRRDRIYVHCFAGKHRSPLVVYLYLQSLGYTEEEAFSMFDTQWGKKEVSEGNWLKRFYDKDVEGGRIPKDTILFMKKVRENPTKSLLEILNLLLI